MLWKRITPSSSGRRARHPVKHKPRGARAAPGKPSSTLLPADRNRSAFSEIYCPDKRLLTGTMMLVIPGGGMQRLAYEHEGLEVAQWLNRQGIVTGVLKYRGIGTCLFWRHGCSASHQPAAAACRPMGGGRSIWGCFRFSAGGEIGLWLSTRQSKRLYSPLDATDAFSCHLDFAGLIYSGGLLERRRES